MYETSSAQRQDFNEQNLDIEATFFCYREYKINVRDNAFKPQILVIEEGDRVWWEWSGEEVLVKIYLIILNQHISK